jgi:hypothetical protein
LVFGPCASSSRRRWNRLPDIRNGMEPPWAELLAANERGSPNRISTPATRFGWNSTKTSWLLSGWSAAPSWPPAEPVQLTSQSDCFTGDVARATLCGCPVRIRRRRTSTCVQPT